MKLGLMKASMYRRDIPWQKHLTDASEAAKLADDLGFSHVYFDGICGDGADGINPSTLLLAKVADVTERIKAGIDSTMLGTPATQSYALTVSLLDQLLDGRLFLGLPSHEVSCNCRRDNNLQDGDPNTETYSKTLAHLLERWRDTVPFNSSDFFGDLLRKQSGSTPEQLYKCPHPDIWSFIGSGNYEDVEVAASEGFHPVSASWMSPKNIAGHWPAFVAGATRSARRACPSSWQIARSFFVCDNEETALRYVKGKNSPYRQYYKQVLNLEGNDADVDSLLEKVVIMGSVNKVTDEILALGEEVGEFGTLLYLDLAWSDRDLARSSMKKMAEQVMPAVQAANSQTTKILERT